MRTLYKLNLFAFGILLSLSVNAQVTWNTTAPGDWEDSDIWDCADCGAFFPSRTLDNQVVNINHDVTNGGDLIGSHGSHSVLSIASGMTLNANSYSLNGGSNHEISGGGTLNLTTHFEQPGGYNTMDNSTTPPTIIHPLYEGEDVSIIVGGSVNSTGGGGSNLYFGPLYVTGNLNFSNGNNYFLTGETTADNMICGGPNGGGIEVKGNANIRIDKLISLSNDSDIRGNGSLGWGSLFFDTADDSICDFGKADAEANLIPNPINLVDCSPFALPIVLSYFEVENTAANTFQFDWSTYEEINNDYFTIEYSFDLYEFDELAEIAGAGTNYSAKFYEFISNLPTGNKEIVYFRLKQTDFDGTYTYSSVVPVSISENAAEPESFEVYPNPASGRFTIYAEGFDVSSTTTASIINSFSQEVEETIAIEALETEVSLSGYTPGVYFVKLEGSSQVMKLIVQ